jgi:hypothetical protein
VKGALQLMQRVPEPKAGEVEAVVLDLQLTGEMDSAAAHYKLLQSGSLSGGEPGKAPPKGKGKAAAKGKAAPEAAPEAGAPKRRKR